MISKFSNFASISYFCLICLGLSSCSEESPSTAALNQVEATKPAPTTTKPAWLLLPEQLDKLRASFSVPGTVIVAIDQCEPSAPLNSGNAILSPEVAVTDETVFEAASLSKPLFAFLVLKLVEDGIISLDETIAKSLAYPRIEDEEKFSQLTPRLILSHQTGLPNWVGNTDNPDRSDIISFLKEPGTEYSYSGEGYELLRTFIELKTNKSLEDLFREELGGIMPHSGFAPIDPSTSLSKGYRTSEQSDDGRDIRYLGGGAGGLATTAADYARFVSMICKGYGLPDDLMADYLAPQVKLNSPDYPPLTAWSLGWGVMPMGAETFIFHDGNNNEFRTFAGFSKNTGEGLIILTNGRNGGDLISAILERSQ